MPYVRAALEAGYGKMLEIKGIETAERAHKLRQGIYNAAGHHDGISAEAGWASRFSSGDEMGIHQNTDGTFTLRFRVWDKHKARVRHIEVYGKDRSQWPYNPYQKGF